MQEEAEEEEEKRTLRTRERGNRESWSEEARGEKRGRTHGGKEGRDRSSARLKHFFINKQTDESKRIIQRGVTGAPPRRAYADKTATVRAETDKFCVSLWNIRSSCSSNFRRTSKSACDERFPPPSSSPLQLTLSPEREKEIWGGGRKSVLVPSEESSSR